MAIAVLVGWALAGVTLIVSAATRNSKSVRAPG
jgi:hypothetical protein